MSIPPPQRTITEEGLALLYQKVGQLLHENCELAVRVADRERRLAEAARLKHAGDPDAIEDEPTPIMRAGGGG